MENVAFEDLEVGMVVVETMVIDTRRTSLDQDEYRTYLGNGRFECADGRIESEDADPWDNYQVVGAIR